MAQRVSQKLFVVYISNGDNTEVFRSLEDMPDSLRQKLVRVARHSYIDTLVIANEKGREMLENEGMSRNAPEPGQTDPLSKRARWAIACMLAAAVGLLMLAVLQFSER